MPNDLFDIDMDDFAMEEVDEELTCDGCIHLIDSPLSKESAWICKKCYYGRLDETRWHPNLAGYVNTITGEIDPYRSHTYRQEDNDWDIFPIRHPACIRKGEKHKTLHRR